jgi:hypothetical protein
VHAIFRIICCRPMPIFLAPRIVEKAPDAQSDRYHH